jgi:hypothetical protein
VKRNIENVPASRADGAASKRPDWRYLQRALLCHGGDILPPRAATLSAIFQFTFRPQPVLAFERSKAAPDNKSPKVSLTDRDLTRQRFGFERDGIVNLGCIVSAECLTRNSMRSRADQHFDRAVSHGNLISRGVYFGHLPHLEACAKTAWDIASMWPRRVPLYAAKLLWGSVLDVIATVIATVR